MMHLLIGCGVALVTSVFGLLWLDAKNYQATPARHPVTRASQAGPGWAAALSPPALDLPEATQVRDDYARAAWTNLGARKVAEYGARIDAGRAA